jgi:UrcA family protein
MSITSIRHWCARAAFVAACLSVAGLSASATAFAWNPPEPRSVTVDYRDLNMATLAGATTLCTRIHGAAPQVCGDAGRNLSEQHARDLCPQQAIERAVRAVNSPAAHQRVPPREPHGQCDGAGHLLGAAAPGGKKGPPNGGPFLVGWGTRIRT